jgi:superfamily I DNA/RNA helicase
MLDEIRLQKPKAHSASWLREVARRLRYQIATREPFVPDETADIQVATLWGAKGVTADHVYAIGLCDEAIPGTRREEYPGTDRDYEEEQRRLFYVSITRSKRTLVLSRGEGIKPGDAARLGMSVTSTSRYWATLTMSRFLRDIIKYLPTAKRGDVWPGCA